MFPFYLIYIGYRFYLCGETAQAVGDVALPVTVFCFLVADDEGSYYSYYGGSENNGSCYFKSRQGKPYGDACKNDGEYKSHPLSSCYLFYSSTQVEIFR